MSRFVDLAVSTVLLAGLYATMAYGLGLIYGVLRVVNLAHGGAIYQGLVRWLPRGVAGGPASLLLLFGVWLVLRNIAYRLFTGNEQAIRTAFASRAVPVLGTHVAL